jgi:hypothetical protein
MNESIILVIILRAVVPISWFICFITIVTTGLDIYLPENPIDIAVMFTNVLNYGLTEPCSVLISPMASPFQTSSCH